MKSLTLSILIVAAFGSIASQKNEHLTNKNYTASLPGLEQDRTEIGFENLMKDLQRVHKAVYQLPYSYEHIKTVFMPEIEAQRKIIAPHYPSREQTGTDSALINQLFKEWYLTYPGECSAYIAYVDQFVADHSN